MTKGNNSGYKRAAAAEGLTLWAWFKKHKALYYCTHQLVSNAKARSKKIGREFTINAADIRDLYIKQERKCALTGIKLKFQGGMSYNNVSIDRIDHRKGYTHNNVRLTCYWANVARGQLSDIEFRRYCRKVLK